MRHTSALPGACAATYMCRDCDGPGLTSTVIALTERARPLWCRPEWTGGPAESVPWR
jgi:hypothetical protein